MRTPRDDATPNGSTRVVGTGRAPAPPDRRAFLAGAAAVGLAGLAGCAAGSGRAGAGAEAGSAPASITPAGPATTSLPSTASSNAPAVADATPAAQSGLMLTGARMLWVTVPVDPAAAATWLPPTLRVAAPATASVFVAHYPLTSFGTPTYDEAAILLHVEADDGPAWHCPWIIVNDDTALILGREMTGFPKKLGEIGLDEGGGTVRGVAHRKGAELVRIEAPTAGLTPADGGVWTERLVHVNGTFPGTMRMQRIKPMTETVHQRSVGRARLTLGSSPRDDLAPLVPAPTEGDAVFAVLDFGSLTDGGLVGGDPLPGTWALKRQMATAL
ncbi:MAG: acetoacetate decarboxylase family protein [Acidimicrobiales bacterium]